jgi:hypothetical protein
MAFSLCISLARRIELFVSGGLRRRSEFNKTRTGKRRMQISTPSTAYRQTNRRSSQASVEMKKGTAMNPLIRSCAFNLQFYILLRGKAPHLNMGYYTGVIGLFGGNFRIDLVHFTTFLRQQFL